MHNEISCIQSKMANLVEQYYNKAVASIENATTVAEAQSAADNFNRNVDMIKLMDSIESAKSGDIKGVNAMLAVLVVFAVCAFVLMAFIFIKIKTLKKELRD